MQCAHEANDNQLLVWETEDTTSGPTILSSTTTTNLLVITNSIAAVPTDGTPVTATNWVFY